MPIVTHLIHPVDLSSLNVDSRSFFWKDQVLVVFDVSMMKLKNVPQNSTTELISIDLMGTKGINLILGDAKEKATNGTTLISSIELSLELSLS